MRQFSPIGAPRGPRGGGRRRRPPGAEPGGLESPGGAGGWCYQAVTGAVVVLAFSEWFVHPDVAEPHEPSTRFPLWL